MMEESLLQQTFFKDVISKDIKDIFEAQRMIASERIYKIGQKRTETQGNGRLVKSRSHRLMNALNDQQYSFYDTNEGIIATTSLPKYIRFLDMERFGNFHIYNRQIWGILYNNSLRKIRYEYTKEIQDEIRKKLMELFPGEHSS